MIANEPRSPLNIGTATAGARLLRDRDPTRTLRHTGILDTALFRIAVLTDSSSPPSRFMVCVPKIGCSSKHCCMTGLSMFL